MADAAFRVEIEYTAEASSSDVDNDEEVFGIESKDDLDNSGDEYTVRDAHGTIATFPKENVASVTVREL